MVVLYVGRVRTMCMCVGVCVYLYIYGTVSANTPEAPTDFYQPVTYVACYALYQFTSYTYDAIAVPCSVRVPLISIFL